MIARHRIFGIAVMLASIVALFMATISTVRAREHARCQAVAIDALARSQAARADAAEQDWAALDRLVADIAGTDDLVEQRRLRHQYVVTRQQTDRERDAHPVPAPPSQICGLRP